MTTLQTALKRPTRRRSRSSLVCISVSLPALTCMCLYLHMPVTLCASVHVPSQNHVRLYSLCYICWLLNCHFTNESVHVTIAPESPFWGEPDEGVFMHTTHLIMPNMICIYVMHVRACSTVVHMNGHVTHMQGSTFWASRKK